MDNILLIQLLVYLIRGKCIVFTQFFSNTGKIYPVCTFFLLTAYANSNNI